MSRKRKVNDGPAQRKSHKNTPDRGQISTASIVSDWSRIRAYGIAAAGAGRRAARWAWKFCSHFSRARATTSVLAGLSAGGVLLCGLSLVLVAFGTTLRSIIALALAAALGLLAGSLTTRRSSVGEPKGTPAAPARLGRLFQWLAGAGAAAWWAVALSALALVQPWLVHTVVEAGRWVPWSMAGDRVIDGLFVGTVALATVGLTLFVATGLAHSLTSNATPTERHPAAFIIALALSVLISANLLAPLFGLNAVRWTAALLAVATAAAHLWRQTVSTGVECVPEPVATPTVHYAPRLLSANAAKFVAGLALVTGGILVSGLTRMLHQLMPVGLWVPVSELAFVLLGAGLAGWKVWAKRQRPVVGTIGLAAFCSLLLAAFPLFVQVSLDVNAFLGHVAVSIPARLLLLAAAVVPVGAMAALLVWTHDEPGAVGSFDAEAVATGKRSEPGRQAISPAFSSVVRSAAWGCIGFAVGRVLLPIVGTATLVSACCYVLISFGLIHLSAAAVGARRSRWSLQNDDGDRPQQPFGQSPPSVCSDTQSHRRGFQNGRGRPSVSDHQRAIELDSASQKQQMACRAKATGAVRWLQATVTSAAVLIALASMWWKSYFRPDLCAKLLFNSQVFQAKRTGLEPTLLPQLDEARCVAVRESGRSILTVWVLRGATWVVRESGVPKSVVSIDPRVNPQYAPELLHAVLPLCLHRSPRRVLLLGLGGGTQLAACLGFPTQHVVCVEPDQALVQLTRERLARTGEASLDDNRLQLLLADPATALCCGSARFDVILDNPDSAALLHSTSRWSRSYYCRVARHLANDGLYCQRFQSIDFGPESLQTIVQTLRSVFPQVMVMETAPGEMLLMASRLSASLVQPGLLDRLKGPHVRHLLASAGLDWAQLLQVVAYVDAEKSDDLEGPLNSLSNVRLAFRLPLEVLRWGPKRQQMVASLARYTRLLASLVGPEAQAPEVQLRLREVQKRAELLSEYPDQYWVYRKAVRDQLTKRPRTKIELTGGEPRRTRTPDDQHRLDFLKALGQAVRSPDRAHIHEVERYERPYDPLVSYFLHAEVASLWARSKQSDPSAELIHRLHYVYFAPPSDRSVRQVIQALKLLREQPSALPDTVQRWDHMNSLLQTLASRWLNRASVRPTSAEIVLNDIDQSVLAVEQTLAKMDRLRPQAGISLQNWRARREFLVRTLIRPLKVYRMQILSRHLKGKQTDRSEKLIVEQPESTNAAKPTPAKPATLPDKGTDKQPLDCPTSNNTDLTEQNSQSPDR